LRLADWQSAIQQAGSCFVETFDLPGTSEIETGKNGEM
jgi:hypothetical protein